MSGISASSERQLKQLLSSKKSNATESRPTSSGDEERDSRADRDRSDVNGSQALGASAAADFGRLPWRQTRVPNLGEGYCAAAMVVRQFLHSPETSQQAQALMQDPQALLNQFRRGEKVTIGNVELSLSPEQVQEITSKMRNGELDAETLGPALLTMGVHNAILERSTTGGATRVAFHAVMNDMGMEGRLVKPGLTGAEPGDFVAYGDSVDEKHLMKVISINSDGRYVLEDAYGERITVTEEEFLASTRRAGGADIGFSSALFGSRRSTSSQ
jgi:hypothetical protein